MRAFSPTPSFDDEGVETVYEAADGRIKALHNDPKGAFSTLYAEVKSCRPVTYTDSKKIGRAHV